MNFSAISTIFPHSPVAQKAARFAVGLAAALLIPATSLAQNGTQCSSRNDDAERLRCYDSIFRMQSEMPARPAADSVPVSATPQDVPEISIPASSMGKRWELEPGMKNGVFKFQPHRQNYILAYTRTNSVNTAPYQPSLDALAATGLIPASTVPLNANEAKFQLSFKVKAWEDIVPNRLDLWLGYTQQSYWQIYNRDISAPFRESNYEPEAMLTWRTDTDVLGWRWRYLTLGLLHQSNGRAEPLSRSWNRIYAEFGMERGPFNVTFRPWYRLKESTEKDDNPDIENYLGHGDMTATYKTGRHQFGLLARYNASSGKGGAQLDWSFPLYGPLRGYAQVFSGYGYNMLDYNHSQTVGGIGVLLTDNY